MIYDFKELNFYFRFVVMQYKTWFLSDQSNTVTF